MDLDVIIIIIGLIVGPSLLITYLYKPTMPVLLGSLTMMTTIVIGEGMMPYSFLIIPALLIAISLWSVFSGGVASE
jgi:hypothetical protein